MPKKRIPKEIADSSTISRAELVERWNLPPGQNIQFFLRMERAGHLTPFKPRGSKRGKIAYRLEEVLEQEQLEQQFMRQTVVAAIANKIRVMPKPSVDEWLGLWYAMWHVLSRLAPMEQRACIEHVINTLKTSKI